MDLISRQAAIDALQKEIDKCIPPFNDAIGAIRCGVRLARNIVEDLPSAERHGRWVDVEPAPHNLFYATCSVCGDRQTIEVANYCPMCGASMDEVEE